MDQIVSIAHFYLEIATARSYFTQATYISASQLHTLYTAHTPEVSAAVLLSVKSSLFIPSDSCHFSQQGGMIGLGLQQSSMFEVSADTVYETGMCVTCYMWGCS